MKKTVFLIVGVVLTILFLISPSWIYELVDGQSEFANEMYNENYYFIIAVITALVTWVGAAVFYYAINSVSFSRWYHWLLSLVVVAFASTFVSVIYLNGALSTSYGGKLFTFAVVEYVVSALLFVISSFGLRWWSSNCRHTPIPE